MTRKRTPYLSDIVDMIDSENPQTIEVHGKTYTQVIRCKDCKYFICSPKLEKNKGFCDANWYQILKRQDDFCSVAQKK